MLGVYSEAGMDAEEYKRQFFEFLSACCPSGDIGDQNIVKLVNDGKSYDFRFDTEDFSSFLSSSQNDSKVKLVLTPQDQQLLKDMNIKV